MKTRRKFLAQFSVLAGGLAFAPAEVFARSPRVAMKELSLNNLSYVALAAQVGTYFRVEAGPERVVNLEMVDATQAPQPERTAPHRLGAPQYECFSLIFRGSHQEALDQKIHCFEHAALGRFEMFITPVVSRDPTRRYYEAIFNRPVITETSSGA